MGCECSKESKIQPEDPALSGEVVVTNKRPIMVKQGAAQPEKLSFKEFTYTISVIKKNDIFLIHQLLKNKKPTENLSIYGSRSTYLHYAAKFNAYRAMSIFINWIKENIPDHLYSIINTQDSNGRTPAMVCASYSSAESLFILLQSGEVQEEIRDVERRSLRDLCEKHSKSCLIIMKRIKDFGKDFSLANALLSIQRINKLTKIFKGVMDVFTASRKLRSYTNRHRTSQPSYPTQLSQNTEPDSPHRGKGKDTGFGFLKPKAAGKFSGTLIWCKYKRDPGFDRKFQKHLTKVSTIEKKPKFSIVSLPTYAGGEIKKALTEVHLHKKMASHVEELTEYQDNDFSLNPQDHVEEYSDESSQGNDSEDYYEEEEEIDIEENILTEIMRKKDEHKQQLGSSSMYPKLETHYEEENFPNPKTFSILKKVGSQSQNFTDTDFPPSPEVIGAGWLEKNAHLDIVWQRPHEFLSVDYDSVRLFNRIDPHDIEQGQLGVCYLLAALSAVAEFPSRIQKVFVNQRSNPHGVYGVKFFVQGIPTEIVLDDYFPCVRSNSKENKDKMRPIFSKPKGNELWVLILEKAWAKLFGTYAVTETGVSDEAFEYILGVPSFMYLADHQSADEMWKIIYNADRKNYIISASTLQLTDNDMGLASSHTYSVISAHKVGGYRILKLRNPWGRFEWNGDFSDYSPLWTPEIKQQVGYVKAEDGMFCMTIEDFKTYFMGYVIAKYKDDWVYSYVKGDMEEEHAQYFKFAIEYPTEVYLRVHQKNERFQDTPGYASVDFRVAHVEDNGDYRLLAAKSKYIDDTAIFGHHSVPPTRKHKLSLKKAGTYIVRVKMLLGNLDRKEFTVSAYSPDKITLEPIPSEKEYLTKGFLNLGMRAKHKEEIDNGCYIARGFSGYNLYIYAENNGEQVWTLSMSFPKLMNAKLGKPYRVAKNSFKMVLKPGEKKVTYLTIIDLQNPQTYANPIFDHKWE